MLRVPARLSVVSKTAEVACSVANVGQDVPAMYLVPGGGPHHCTRAYYKHATPSQITAAYIVDAATHGRILLGVDPRILHSLQGAKRTTVLPDAQESTTSSYASSATRGNTEITGHM
eukprot:m.416497 g.416497  ORF g.416497 m.416497 type:complete len:117 (-) comp21280_c0_seq4:1524-1874(-)